MGECNCLASARLTTRCEVLEELVSFSGRSSKLFAAWRSGHGELSLQVHCACGKGYGGDWSVRVDDQVAEHADGSTVTEGTLHSALRSMPRSLRAALELL